MHTILLCGHLLASVLPSANAINLDILVRKEHLEDSMAVDPTLKLFQQGIESNLQTETAHQSGVSRSTTQTWIIAIGISAIIAIAAGIIGYFVWKKRSESQQPDASEAVCTPSKVCDDEVKAVVKPEDIDVSTLLKLMVQKGVQTIGPKLAKGQAMRNVLDTSLSNFGVKGRNFVMTEMNSIAASLMQAVEAEEAMLLLDLNDAVESNFPPVGVLLAGVLSPILIGLRLLQHILQPVVLLAPICLGIWAIALDGVSYCAVPSIHIWLYAQTLAAIVLAVSHACMISKITAGQRRLRERSTETGNNLAAQADITNLQFATMRDMFVNQSVLLQEALITENDIRQSPFNNAIGIGTIAWLLIAVWNVVLIAGWTFVPGRIAFHPAAELSAGADFCGAWRTVLVLRISSIVQVLFFFFNVGTVIGWLSDQLVDSPVWSDMLLRNAKAIDQGMSGLPVMQLLIKGTLLRGTADLASARFNVAKDEERRLLKEQNDAKKHLEAIEAKLQSATQRVNTLKPQSSATCSQDIEAQIAVLREKSFHVDDWKERGKHAVEDAKARAYELEKATTAALEKLIEKIMEAIATLTDSEAGRVISGHLSIAREKLQESQAMQSLQQMDMQALSESAKSTVLSVQQSEALQIAKAQALAAAQQLQDSDAGRLAVEQVRAASQQLQDTTVAVVSSAQEISRSLPPHDIGKASEGSGAN